MISSSQINLFQDSSRQQTLLDSRHLRVQQAGSGSAGSQPLLNATLAGQAAYRYTSQEQLAFTSNSEISGAGGTSVFTSADLIDKSRNLLLMGQQALGVGRAVFGSSPVADAGNTVTVTAGRYSFHSETESRNFTAGGSIQLQNGETIEFTLSLRQEQSRTYEYSEMVEIRERPMTDPLVINFGASTARLTDTLFEFDLKGNGQTGQYATLASGSGYLVLDRNGNGKVDDGSELFGPASGSGFSELARYDDDGNQWIDASDEIFSSLSVWVQTADGGQALRSLEEVGVQALYVGSVEDRFTLTSPQGVPLGQIRASGIYLTTDGEVRTLEELDLAEQSRPAPVVAQTVTASGSSSSQAANQADPRAEAIRSALEKLQEIRRKQQDFIEASKEQHQSKSPLEEYLRLIDRLRLELLNSQDQRKQAASRYLEFARSR